jgi:hypothetical protein
MTNEEWKRAEMLGNVMDQLADLSTAQWNAAQEAAKALMRGTPDREADRAAYNVARAKLAALLPAGVDAREIIISTARWNMVNDIAAMCAGLPAKAIA